MKFEEKVAHKKISFMHHSLFIFYLTVYEEQFNIKI